MTENLREAQMVMLELLFEFDRICTKHKLSYWLDFGTLLGAVRHKGFIPWDDDLDVAMPREDYEKFLKIATDELKDDVFLQTKQSDKTFFAHFTKLRDRKSTYIEIFEEGNITKYHQGIYMDIFPVNYISNRKPIKYSYTLLKYLTKFFSNRYIAIDFFAIPLIKLMIKFHNKNNNFVVRGGEMMTNELKLNKNEIFPLKKIEFEGHFFNVPKNYDTYLKQFYGNYMDIPSVSKRTYHHIYISVDELCDKEKVNR